MPVIFFHRTGESTEYTVPTHIGVWVKTKISMLSFSLSLQCDSAFTILFCILLGLADYAIHAFINIVTGNVNAQKR